MQFLNYWSYGKNKLLFVLSAMMFVSVGVAHGAPSLDNSTDLGTQSKLTVSELYFNYQTKTFDSVLSISNTSRSTLVKPFTIAVLSLPSGVILANATAMSDDGIPLITLEGDSLAPGATITTPLKFMNRTNESFPIVIRIVRLEQPVPDLVKLQGVDVNGNGVRDDLDALIISRYGNDIAKRNAAFQVLREMRNSLGATGSVESAFHAALSLHKSLDCLYKTFGLNDKINESEFLEEKMMNTYSRRRAWKDFFNMLAGQSIPIRFSNPCGMK